MRDHRHPHGRGPGFRPPWWPEDEPFPPQDREGWRAMRGRFFRRIAIGIALFFAFVFVVGWLGAAFGGGWFERGGTHRGFFPWFLVFPVLLVLGFVAFGRAIPRHGPTFRDRTTSRTSHVRSTGWPSAAKPTSDSAGTSWRTWRTNSGRR